MRKKLKYGITGVAGLLAAIVLPLMSVQAESDMKQAVVVELFTSQGCSSCPPAEAFMQDLAKRDDVIGLEFHVDYWDYIGWADPFADPAYTDRQRAYVRTFGDRYVYTPQMVIDGARHVVGSRRLEVESVIRTARSERAENQPDITIRHEGGDILISVEGRSGDAGRYEVNLVSFQRPEETRVTRGENSGRTLHNARVVRSLERLGHWDGDAFSHKVAMDDLPGDGGCVVLIQKPNGGQVLTAAVMKFDPSS